MEKINIRKITAADIDALHSISVQTFYETFSAMNSEENMTKYLETNLSKNRLQDELNDDKAAFYFAEVDGNVVGYLKLNSGQSQTELIDQNGLEIERIYVLKELLGKKIGQQLYEKAIDIARGKNAEFVWLGVWEENERAISFYKKHGFAPFDKHVFNLGDDEQTDIMMKLELKGTSQT